jgi:hypothetical protein
MGRPSTTADRAHRNQLAAVWPPNAAVAAKAGHKLVSPMQAIRRKCLDCCCGQIVEVKLCEAVACPLWPFRAGRHPYTKTRVQKASPAACVPDGTLVAGNPSPSGIGLQDASFSESEAILASSSLGTSATFAEVGAQRAAVGQPDG